ncbi:MAG: MBL fold metallo-hydrolase [Candidatus Riflebacteria bacterium]|nr:MBL fold metallo-hydrolase [Candidatus Riflebacteria bacterium]
MTASRWLGVALVLATLVSAAWARPPAYLEQLTKGVRHVALNQGGPEGNAGAVSARAAWLAPFLPARHAEALGLAVTQMQQGNKAGVEAALAKMPAWPAVTLQVLGAAQQVPGSCHLLRAPAANILVDCGMDQGNDEESREFNAGRFPFDPKEIDILIVTHGHIDHTGLIPRLTKEGFRGKILTTATTAELLKVLLEDSAELQQHEGGRKRGGRDKRGRKGGGGDSRKPHPEPLYSMEDVNATMELVNGLNYDQVWSDLPGVKVRLKDAGHLPGSAAAEVWVSHGTGETKVVFGGDTGNYPYPMLRDPQPVEGADVLLLESTYGARVHDVVTLEERYSRFKKSILGAIADRGVVLIPAFAVGRAETLLYWLGRMKNDGSLSADVPVVFDTPMGIKTLEIMRRHPECLDPAEASAAYSAKRVFVEFPGLHLGLAKGEPVPDGAIVIASSGMLAGGKIVQYVQQFAREPTTDILFSGFQAEGTPGRQLQDGATEVAIQGRRVQVRAKVATLDGMSGHADQKMLIQWVKSFGKRPGKIIVVHGEPESGQAMAELIKSELGIESSFPARGEIFELTE